MSFKLKGLTRIKRPVLARTAFESSSGRRIATSAMGQGLGKDGSCCHCHVLRELAGKVVQNIAQGHIDCCYFSVKKCLLSKMGIATSNNLTSNRRFVEEFGFGKCYTSPCHENL